jgi:hypothetical protein
MAPDHAKTHQTLPAASEFRVYTPRKFNRRSRQRFIADRTSELIRHLGREPSYPEKIIISRVIAIEFELRKYDDAIADGVELSGHALRARLAGENRLRLDLAALGLRPTTPKIPTLADVLRAAEREVAA